MTDAIEGDLLDMGQDVMEAVIDRGMKSSLRDPKVDLKLAIFSSCLRIMVLGYPPLPEETPGVVAVVGVRGVQR